VEYVADFQGDLGIADGGRRGDRDGRYRLQMGGFVRPGPLHRPAAGPGRCQDPRRVPEASGEVEDEGSDSGNYPDEGGSDNSNNTEQSQAAARTPETPPSDEAIKAAEQDALKAKVEQCKEAQDRYQKYITSQRLYRELPGASASTSRTRNSPKPVPARSRRSPTTAASSRERAE
jgi:hypothetical protein